MTDDDDLTYEEWDAQRQADIAAGRTVWPAPPEIPTLEVQPKSALLDEREAE